MHNKTDSSWAAAERDKFHCQWCLWMTDRIVTGTDAHHLFRPWYDYDKPEWIITLCHDCHLGGRHTQGTITDRDIISKVMIPNIWRGANLSPYGTYGALIDPQGTQPTT